MKFSRFINIALAAVCILAVGCKGGGGSTTSAANGSALVVFCQASKVGPWRQMYDNEMADSAKKHASDFKFQEVDAGGDANKQISQIHDAVTQKAKVLMVSPVSEAVFPAMDSARKAGVFVFLLDYYVKDSPVADSYAGANQFDTGFSSGSYLTQVLHHKGDVLILSGPGLIDQQRVACFKDWLTRKFPKVNLIDGGNCDGSESKAKDVVTAYLKAGKPCDAIYAADDNMAMGAGEAVKAAKAPIQYIEGNDACQKSAMDAIKNGTIFATFTDPPGGPKALDLTPDLLNGHMPPKENLIFDDTIDASTVDNYLKRNPSLVP